MKNPPLQSSVSSCLTTYNKDFDDDDDDDNDVSQRSTTADPQYTPVIHRLAIRRWLAWQRPIHAERVYVHVRRHA